MLTNFTTTKATAPSSSSQAESSYWESEITTATDNSDIDNATSFLCLRGQLLHSKMWLFDCNCNSPKDRRITISLTDKTDALAKLSQQLGGKFVTAELCIFDHRIKSAIAEVKFCVNDARANKLLDCIKSIDQVAPFDTEALFRISTWAAGYAITGEIGKAGFSPLLVFLMAMNKEKILLEEITRYICQLFIQSTGIVFDEGLTNSFYEEFTVKELRRIKPVEKTVAGGFDNFVHAIFNGVECAIV